MIVLVCGGRDYTDYARVRTELNKLRPTLIVHGRATGADSLAELYAYNYGVAQVMFPANWNGEGRSAGYLRNARMLQYIKPDLVLAFPGGKGTEMMCKLAEGAGVHVERITGTHSES